MKKGLFYILPAVFLMTLWTQYHQLDLTDLMDTIREEGLMDFSEQVSVNVLPEPSYRKVIEDFYRDNRNPQLAGKEQILLEWLGYAGKEFDWVGARRDVYEHQLKSFYHSDNKEVLVPEGQMEGNLFNRMYLAHALREAIWDQKTRIFQNPHFQLSDLDDRKLALVAAYQGDCTYLMLKIADFSPEMMRHSDDSDTLLSYLPRSGLATMRRFPDAVQSLFLMPYFQGVDFINHLFDGVKRKNKKIKRMEFLFSQPPVCTSHILHPEKYLEGWMPESVDIHYLPAEAEVFHSGTIGEFSWGLMIDGRDTKGEYLEQWKGDQFTIYRCRPQGLFFFSKSSWMSGEGCREITRGLRRYLTRRFGVEFRKGDGGRFIAGRGGDRYWFLASRDRRLVFVCTDRRDLINTFINGGKYD